MKANRSTISRFAALACDYGVLTHATAMAGASLLLLLGSCAPPQVIPAAPPPSRAAPLPAAPPPAAADWHDALATPGDWRWSRDSAMSIARFGNSDAAALFSLNCNRTAGTITLARGGGASVSASMTIRTTTLARTLGSQTGPSSALTATLSPRDPLLDAMAFSRGRFSVEVAGRAPLYLPSWPEVSRVIEDCR
jgi:hypothetical protein